MRRRPRSGDRGAAAAAAAAGAAGAGAAALAGVRRARARRPARSSPRPAGARGRRCRASRSVMRAAGSSRRSSRRRPGRGSSRACRRGAARRGSGRPGARRRSARGCRTTGSCPPADDGGWAPGRRVLIFPGSRLVSRRRRRQPAVRRDALAVARALADFNSDHRLAEGAFPPARGCGPVPVPGARQVARALGVEAERSRAIVADAPRDRSRMGQSPRDAVERGRALPRAHGSRASATSLLGDRPLVILLDFGHAGTAPVGRRPAHGAALRRRRPRRRHRGAGRRLRGGVRGEGAWPSIRRRCAAASQAHFAARYRDLRFSPRPACPETFEAALALSRELLERGALKAVALSSRGRGHPI